MKNKKVGEREVLAIAKLDSITMSTNPILKDRYKIIGLERLEKGKLNFINETKKIYTRFIKKINFDINLLDAKFGFTYYTKSFLIDLENEYEITNKQTKEILEKLI